MEKKKRKVKKRNVKIVKKKSNKQYNKVRCKKTSKKKNDYPLLDSYKNKNIKEKIATFFKNRLKVMKYDMTRFKKKFKYGTLRDRILILLMLILIAAFSLILLFCGYIIKTAPEISEKRLYKNNSSILLDINGNEFARLGVEKREKVSYDELPEVLIDGIIATEDSRFFQHNGIDIARFSKAIIGQILGHSDAGGGSTLTMQVSKLAATSSVRSGIEGIIRKFTDIYLSVFVLEKKYTKEQILEFYVNIPNLGAQAYGVEQASKNYFGKSVSELTLPEAALIAGLFQAPSAYNPYVAPEKAEARRNQVLYLMARHGYITQEEKKAAQSVPVKSLLIGQTSGSGIYQDFIDTVSVEIEKRTGNDPARVPMVVHTTMDPARQEVVANIMSGKTYTWKNDYAQAGIAVINVKDGSLSAVGASRDPAALVLNYALTASNHPGSTAKPILDYGPAIEYLNWSTGQTIIDDTYTYTGGQSIKNFDNRFNEVMTIKTALAQSRNIPALFAFQQTTNEQKAEFAGNLKWKPETDNGRILETCSIGGFKGVTPLESAAAYATFARGGTYIEPYSFTEIEYPETGETFKFTPQKKEAMSDSTAYMINMILKYAVTNGHIGAGSVSGTDIAAKTGTSTISAEAKKELNAKGKNVIGDSWEVAYSPDYAISTWYGYPQRTKDYFLTSEEGGKARKEITKTLVKGIMKKNSRFKKPSSVVTATIELGTDPIELASEYTPEDLKSTEYFKKGTVPTTVSDRFSKLNDTSKVTYTSTDNTVTLNWNAVQTPNAINEVYLRDYFSSNVYKNWADKYLAQRLDYNKKTFGTFGYEVYMTNESGTTDLGFTTSTTYTANVEFSSNTIFTVKTSYQKFKSNQSNGVSVVVEANSTNNTAPEEIPQTTTTQAVEQVSYAIEYRGQKCSTVSNFNNLGPKNENKIKITSNNEDVTEYASITCQAYNELGETLDCNSLQEGKEYDVIFTVKYKNNTRNKQIQLHTNNNC